MSKCVHAVLFVPVITCSMCLLPLRQNCQENCSKYIDQNFWTELAKPSVQLMYTECLLYHPTRTSRLPIRSIQNGNSLRVGSNNLEHWWWGNWLNLTSIEGQSLLFTTSYLCKVWYECFDQDSWTLLLRKCVLL